MLVKGAPCGKQILCCDELNGAVVIILPYLSRGQLYIMTVTASNRYNLITWDARLCDISSVLMFMELKLTVWFCIANKIYLITS